MRRVTQVQRDNGKALRLAAMKAMIRYIKDPRVHETFERLRGDTDPDIARMASYCLNTPQDTALRIPEVPATKPRPGATGVARANAPQPGGTVPGMPRNEKPRRGFEELESSAGADVFRPGTTISGKYAKPLEQGQVMFSGGHQALDPSALPDDLFAGLKPLLEGELQELGLGMTARITCAKNGVMKIKSSLGNGIIYIQNKIVVGAFFSGMTDIQALAAMSKLKQAQFAYFAKSFSYAATMSVEVSNIETAIREYLDMR
jgi:hypothetical protein